MSYYPHLDIHIAYFDLLNMILWTAKFGQTRQSASLGFTHFVGEKLGGGGGGGGGRGRGGAWGVLRMCLTVAKVSLPHKHIYDMHIWLI